ncbi:phosphatase PAP2 family protein [Streptomyces sp. bgisy027]|uniref:phosphatase PAP2 family protein n=1 Tax=Streptomyces sp. bgisy027 TaxID=3413770 RepID=UPI003D7195D3
MAATWTEAGLLSFAALFVLAWRRARRDTTRAFAIAPLAPMAMAVAYVISEVLKSGFTDERPCRAVTLAAPPSATALTGRALIRLTAPPVLLMAFSRVFVGIRSPHDVVAVLAVGALAAIAAVQLRTGPARPGHPADRGDAGLVGPVRPVVHGTGTGARPLVQDADPRANFASAEGRWVRAGPRDHVLGDELPGVVENRA